MYRSQTDERLSWPGRLTYSRRFTHISGHPSATGQARDRVSLPAKDQRSTAVPCNQWEGSGWRMQCERIMVWWQNPQWNVNRAGPLWSWDEGAGKAPWSRKLASFSMPKGGHNLGGINLHLSDWSSGAVFGHEDQKQSVHLQRTCQILPK